MEKIINRQSYLFFLERDKRALHINRSRPRIFQDEIWKFERALRYTEYVTNCYTSLFFKPYVLFTKWRFHRKSRALGFSIPLNVFESGLSIGHYGTIVVNGNAHIGKNCRILEGVNIGGGVGGGTEDWK